MISLSGLLTFTGDLELRILLSQKISSKQFKTSATKRAKNSIFVSFLPSSTLDISTRQKYAEPFFVPFRTGPPPPQREFLQIFKKQGLETNHNWCKACPHSLGGQHATSWAFCHILPHDLLIFAGFKIPLLEDLLPATSPTQIQYRSLSELGNLSKGQTFWDFLENQCLSSTMDIEQTKKRIDPTVTLGTWRNPLKPLAIPKHSNKCLKCGARASSTNLETDMFQGSRALWSI